MPFKTTIIVGMTREATIAKAFGCPIIVAAGNAVQLAIDIQAAIANGSNRFISFGVAGALDPDLFAGEMIFPDYVIDGKNKYWCSQVFRRDLKQAIYLTGLPFTYRGIISVPTPVDTPAEKATLYKATKACAVDMETAIMARIASAHKLPFVVIRAISDTAQTLLPAAAMLALDANGSINVWAVLKSTTLNLLQLPALIRLGLDSYMAFSRLRKVAKAIGVLD